MLRYKEVVRGGPGFGAPPRAIVGVWVKGGESVH